LNKKLIFFFFFVTLKKNNVLIEYALLIIINVISPPTTHPIFAFALSLHNTRGRFERKNQFSPVVKEEYGGE